MAARRCDHVSETGSRCRRSVESDKTRCLLHRSEDTTVQEKKAEFNEGCPICLEDEEQDMYLLSCHHRCHLACMKGMNKLVCPICRSEIINLPDKIKNGILANSQKYAQEQDATRTEEFMEMMRSEMGSHQNMRMPPQMEIFLAMRYLYELGIPVSRIPSHVELTIDPESPLPIPGSIFQNTVTKIIEAIQNQIENSVEEDDSPDELVDSDESTESDEENPFYLEGQDLRRISHSIRTVPIPNPRAMSIARQVPMLFNTMSVVLSELSEHMNGPQDFSDDSFSDMD